MNEIYLLGRRASAALFLGPLPWQTWKQEWNRFKIATCRLLLWLCLSPHCTLAHKFQRFTSDDCKQNTLFCAVMCGWEKSLEMSVWKKIKTMIPNANRNIWRRCCCVGFQSVSQMKRLEECVYCAVLWSLKDKASRIERIVGEHRLFSQGLKELQDWVCEAQRVLSTCISSTTDKGVLEDRMLQLEVRRAETGVGSLKGIRCNYQKRWCFFIG